MKAVAHWLRSALELWKECCCDGRIRDSGRSRQKKEALEAYLSDLLRDRVMRDPDNQRLVDELGYHDDRGDLLRFLWSSGMVEPTNNRAERDLRLGVIARKVSHCSTSWNGARARELFTSVLATLSRRRNPSQSSESISDILSLVLAGAPTPAPSR